MRIYQKLIALLSIILCPMVAAEVITNITYVNANTDAKFKHLNMQEQNDFEWKVFKKHSSEAFSVEHQQNWDLKLGWNSSANTSYGKALVGNSSLFNTGMGANHVDPKTKIRIDSFNVDVLGYKPINESAKVNWVGAIGIGYAKPRFDAITSYHTMDNLERGARPIPNGKRKIIPRIGLGAEYQHDKQFGLRGMLRWENTSRLRSKFSKQKNAIPNTLSKDFKNSFAIIFGFVYRFP